MYFSRSSGRNNKPGIFLLPAALRVSPRVDERTLKILSEWEEVWKEYSLKQRLHGEEKESFFPCNLHRI